MSKISKAAIFIRHISRHISLLVILLAIAAFACFAVTAAEAAKEAAGPDAPDTPNTIDATRVVRDDGLVLLHAKRTKLPLIKVVMVIRSGSVSNPEGLDGLANMTAALLTEGTATRSSEEFSQEIEFIGASIGASAGHDYTTLSLSVLKKDIQKGFELLADAVLNPAFTKEEFLRKRELALGNLTRNLENPNYVSSRAFMNAVFGSHPYGKNNAGTPQSLMRITRDDLIDFHKTHYTPANTILAAVGDLDAGELDSLLNEHFGSWRGEAPERPVLPALELKDPVTVFNRMDISQANIYFGHIGLERSHPDYYAALVMNYTLGGGGFSSRLMDRVRDDLGLAYSIHSTFSPYLESGVFYVNVQTRNDAASTVIREIRSIINNVRDEGITAEELESAKAYLTGSFPRRLSTMGKTASFLALTEYYGLGLRYPDTFVETINSLTLEDIKDAARKHLHTESAVLSIAADLEAAGLDKQGQAEDTGDK